jgi:hypothetical protein
LLPFPKTDRFTGECIDETDDFVEERCPLREENG